MSLSGYGVLVFTVGGEENKEEESVVKKGRRFGALMCVRCMQSNA